MKNITRTFASITVMLTALLAESHSICHAQVQSALNTESASVVEVSFLPTNGIFWSMEGKLPPAPFDPLPQLNLYTDGTPGNYYYDDRDFDYQTYWAEVGRSRNGEGQWMMRHRCPAMAVAVAVLPEAEAARATASFLPPTAMFHAKRGPIFGWKFPPVPIPAAEPYSHHVPRKSS